MNQLDKLIEQYERETTQRAHINRPFDFNYTTIFVEWLASRPTCGVEQRKFLDEVEEKAKYVEGGSNYEDLIRIEDEDFCIPTEIHGEHFKADLQKVIKGK